MHACMPTPYSKDDLAVARYLVRRTLSVGISPTLISQGHTRLPTVGNQGFCRSAATVDLIRMRMPPIQYVRRTVIDSTMDECRRVLAERRAEQQQQGGGSASNTNADDADAAVTRGSLLLSVPIVVTAKMQTAGRGTGGRPWLCDEGNLFMTMAIPKARVPEACIPVLPLTVGVAVHASITSALAQQPQPPTSSSSAASSPAAPVVKAKWPNDVLINAEKVAGCLIEDDGDCFLAGIGVNVASCPTPTDGGRRATCLATYAPSVTADALAKIVSEQIVRQLAELTDRLAVVERFRGIMDWHCAMYSRAADGKSRGRKVRAVRMGEWGELVVEDLETQERTTLCADYLI